MRLATTYKTLALRLLGGIGALLISCGFFPYVFKCFQPSMHRFGSLSDPNHFHNSSASGLWIDAQRHKRSPSHAGLPPVQNDYDPALGQAAEALAKKWHTSDLMAIGSQGPRDASPNDIKDWSSEMLVAFLDKLASYRAKQPMHKQTTRHMAKLYSLNDSKNAEIRGSWYKLAINAGMMLLLTLLMGRLS